ncbi:MAG: VOC family protein [Proteobacteria bacterium]|nr:VOC family protein [Pseudomonadota bacterium]
MKFAPLFTFFCRDVELIMRFYQGVCGWTDVPEYSSDIYRVLVRDGVQIGFNGWKAYDLLGLSGRKRQVTQEFPVNSMLSFVVEHPHEVDAAVRRVEEMKGRIVQGPFPTYYGHWQLVFSDPEGNIGRVTCGTLPKGVAIPTVDLT